MHSALFQDWTTIRTSGSALSAVQSKEDWLDVGPYADAIFWIDIAQATVSQESMLYLETAPAPLESLFVELDRVPLLAASTGPIVRKIFMNAAGGVPLGRYLRWRLDQISSVTFRIHVSLGEGVRDAFSPLNLPGLLLWLRADLGVVTSLGEVTDWKDQSGNGNHVVQTVAGSRPAVNKLSNGRPAISFNASRFLENTATSLVSAGSAYSVLCVAQNGNGTLLTIRRSTPFSVSRFQTSITYVFSDGATAPADITVANTLAETQSASSPFKSCHRYKGAGQNPDIYLNTTLRSITSVGTNQTTESGSTGFHVGRNSVGDFWNGLISEVIVCSGAIAPADRLRVEQYQKDFWGF